MVLIKTDKNGEEEWYNFYGEGTYSNGSCVHYIDGWGYIVAGTTSSSMGDSDLWLVRIDETGNEVWDHLYGGTGSDHGTNVELTADSCFFATGYTMSFGAGLEDVYALKVDMNGQMIWQRAFGGPERDIAHCGEQLDDNGYIIGGYTYSFDPGPFYDAWLEPIRKAFQI